MAYYDPRAVNPGGYPPNPAGGYPAPGSYVPPPAGFQCKAGHALYYQVHTYGADGRGGYNCDRCRQTQNGQQYRWCCVPCGYDLCYNCAPPPAQGGYAPPQQGGYAPPQQGGYAPPQQQYPSPQQQQYAPPQHQQQNNKCAKGHSLVFETYNYPGNAYRCDRCGTETNSRDKRWRCPPCTYDCCTRCVPAPSGGGGHSPSVAASSSSSSGGGSKTCPHGHQLTFEVIPYEGGRYQCDRCSQVSPAFKPRWLCRGCQYDVCNKCLAIPAGVSTSHHSQLTNWTPPPYTGQLDPPTSKGRALLIGINYIKTPRCKLNGCINDANNLRYFLSQRGYQNFVVLTDDASDSNFQPTKANITKALGWLLEGAMPGQSLFFSYSGHGGQTRDVNGDESSGMDETILPCDYATAGQIVDDDLHSMLIKPLPKAVRLTCVMDCCHSGTGLDLPFVYDGTSTRADPRGLVAARDLNQPGLALLVSGCEDEQTSADATGLAGAGKATGALTFTWIDLMNKNPNMTYAEMLQRLRQKLKSSGFSQVPQFSYNLQNFSVQSPAII